MGKFMKYSSDFIVLIGKNNLDCFPPALFRKEKIKSRIIIVSVGG